VTEVLNLKANDSPAKVAKRIMEERLFDDSITDAFNIYILLKTLGDNNEMI